MKNLRATVFLLATVVGAAAHAADAGKPNVLVMMADDLGYADIGANGAKDIATPHIDSIARNGIRFTSGYVSSCMCSPSRAGLLTGRSQSRFGHEINWEGADPTGKKGLPVAEKTFADFMRAGGYRTGIVGKWHLGETKQFHPLSRGFDEFFGFLGGGHDYLRDPRDNNLLQRDWKPAGPVRRESDESRYLTTVLGKEASGFINRNRAQPWFLYLAFNAPHTPSQATAALLARVKHIAEEPRRTHAAMVVALDDAVGTVLAQLREDGLEERTLVVFLSDNGGPLERNGSLNTPLSGEKGGMLEGGIRVPFFMQWQGRLAAGKIYERPVSSLDLLPTALGISGSVTPKEVVFDGVNLIPFVTGERAGDPHEALFWRMKARGIWAIHTGDWKLVMQKSKAGKHPGGNAPRLINLAADPQELTDLSAREPARAKEMLQRHEAWNATLPEPLWAPEKGDDAPDTTIMTRAQKRKAKQ